MMRLVTSDTLMAWALHENDERIWITSGAGWISGIKHPECETLGNWKPV